MQAKGLLLSNVQSTGTLLCWHACLATIQEGNEDDPLLLEPLYLRRPSITTSTRKQPLLGGTYIDQRPIRQVKVRQKGKRVRYVIDRMTMSDVPRVIEIERLAYPSTWPPSAYRKELQDNRWAHYIVLRDRKIVEERATVPAQELEKPRAHFSSFALAQPSICHHTPHQTWLQLLAFRAYGSW